MEIPQIIAKLRLIPLPGEGGYFRETYRSPEVIPGSSLPAAYPGKRSRSTCIYYMITPESFSAMHKLPGEEIWHFYLGDPAEQLQILPNGESRKIILGNNILKGEELQVNVPANTWQGTRLVDGGKFALFGTTMSPGFEFADYVTGEKDLLSKTYPKLQKEILKYFHD